MMRKAAWFGLWCVLVTWGNAQIRVDHTCVDAARIPRAYLDTVRNLDVFFCHASVGMGMLSGLRTLGNADPARYTLTQAGTGTPATWFDTGNGLIDNIDWAGKGGNGNPLGKVAGFQELIANQGYGARADVAFMKFCYIDFGPSTNVATVWAAYRDTLQTLETAYPAVTFVWLTTALNALGTDGNKRSEFNKLVRDHCQNQGKPLFDLAAIESHDPDGNLALDDHGQETIYAGYTDDNGHFATPGRDRVARALWWLFARVAGWPVAPTEVQLQTKTPVLAANGSATTTLTASLHDAANQIPVRNQERPITFQLTGPGRLVGPNPVTTREGLATITFEASAVLGTAQIVASAPGLQPGQTRIDLITNHAPDGPVALQCHGQTNPAQVPHGHPALTWTFRDADASRGDGPTAYRVILADDPTCIGKEQGNVWDSGKVISDRAESSPCQVPLRPGVRYLWKVMTWDASDVAGSFSGTADFTLANDPGYAVRVDATSGRLDMGDRPALDIHTGNAAGLTVEFWLYRTCGGQATVLLDRFQVGGGGYRVGIDAADHVYFRTHGKHDRRVTALDARAVPGQWHHVACQTAGAAGVIYIDGVQRGRNGLIDIPGSAPLERAWLEPAGALVDELRISDAARYSGNFTPPAGRLVPDANTRGLWHFDEGMGHVAADASGGGSHGALNARHGWGAGTCRRTGNRPPLLFCAGDPTPGGTVDLKVVGDPNQPVVLGISVHPTPLDPPVVLPGYGNLYLAWPLALLPLGTISSSGVITLSLPLPLSMPAPSQFPMQALVGLRLTDCVVVTVR